MLRYRSSKGMTLAFMRQFKPDGDTMKRCCGTCMFSRWMLTPTGRKKKDQVGRCIVEIDDPPVPYSVSRSYGYLPPSQLPRSGIDTDDGKDCPFWQQNDGELKGEIFR